MRDQTTEANDIHICFWLLRWSFAPEHYAQVNDSKLLQANTTPNYIFTIHVHRPLRWPLISYRHWPCSAGVFAGINNSLFFQFDKWQQVSHRFFSYPCDFTTCVKTFFPAPNRSPTMFIPSISGLSITSMVWHRPDGFFHVIVQVFNNTFYQCMR